METMKQYVVRRAFEHKNYRQVSLESGIGEDAYEWLCKIARDEIPNPGTERIEKLYHYYKRLEPRRRAA